ncbi:MAG: D-alanine--D-alanine ligase [Candidatus Latescibacterota bacterium]
MKIAVFMGGSSEEREVSLNSGKAVAGALESTHHEVASYDVEWIGKNTLFTAIEKISRNGTDVVFLALHGGLGENGGVQGILEAAGIPYTGSGITASAAAMDKVISKMLFRCAEIPTAPWISGILSEISLKRIEKEIGFPCVVKPVDQGSTIGLTVVKACEELKGALEKSSCVTPLVMAEAFLPGKELSVPVLGGKALPVIEIRPKHETYDYECKYVSGMTEYLVPAPIPEELSRKVGALAEQVFSVLGLRDIARIDFRLDKNGFPVCLEANSLPGMTATSLVPKSAAASGIDFPQLVNTIADMAYQRKGKR